MSLLSELIGTFLMFVGFIGILAGSLLYRMKQEDLGKVYMTATMTVGGEMSEAPLVRFLARVRGNDSLKRQWGLRILLGGLLVAFVGAWLA
jgi:alkylation response protein AidB-like acyl-CoA dehydrogenase